MPYDAYQRLIEYHRKAEQAHAAAAVSHEKGDHLTAHELTRQAHEHSREALRHAEAAAEHAKTNKP